MTDNRATELLPCPFCGGEAQYYAPGPIEHHIECTNPKCYAVTHGWTTEAEAIAAWNTRAATTIGKVQVEIEPVSRGTLTAEQVHKAVEGHGNIMDNRLYEDWQAVADELNAKLGSGTCELHDCDGSFSAVNRPVWRCDCGAFMTQYTDATTYHKPRFCPNCGRQVT